MENISYHRANSVEDAAQKLSSCDEGSILSGGQTLIPTIKQRLAAPSDLIDVRNIETMKGVTIEGSQVTIGAATCHADVAGHADLKSACPAICDLAGNIGDPQVRHMGTIGGSIANNDPAADYPSAMLALNATICTNNREISAEDFFVGMFETALEEGEIITSVKFTAPAKAGYAKFKNPASRYAIVGVFVAKSADGSARVAVTGAGSDGVFRHADMESALTGNFSSQALEGITTDVSSLMSDLHADAEYRANLISVMAKRAVEKANH